jgi:hypothetical protein
MEHESVTQAEYIEALIKDFRPKINEVLAAHPVPDELSRSELAEALLALQVKIAFDFACTHGVTILEFSGMLRSMASKLESELLAEMQRMAEHMGVPAEADSLAGLVQDVVEAEKKFDRETPEEG